MGQIASHNLELSSNSGVANIVKVNEPDEPKAQD
jgi:hypothetical protein